MGLLNSPNHPASPISQLQVPSPPRVAADHRIAKLAYSISGSKGEVDRLWRTLQALYHPRNLYLLHLDLESPATERLELASRVRSNDVLAELGNVHVMMKANMVTYRGPTMVANTLHSCAVLLRMSKE
ncbi:hypothetical protein AXF42_Ash007360 [Apostasia shenzhenica]|uniref:Uncharacterized protein n=1 Tax=Apostasia shenzhenica TaxID=1088818 RepID=A0A2I0BA04_9ASPA|nr:hypothetical protein AXF42_Ash007360 [Apostasia shenzhenica]